MANIILILILTLLFLMTILCTYLLYTMCLDEFIERRNKRR